MTLNGISSINMNQVRLTQSQETVAPSSLLVENAAIQFMMQQFMNDMYSSVDECPFSVNYKPEW
nr:hypothetical protein 49p1_00037 [Yersinia frederiksenii]